MEEGLRVLDTAARAHLISQETLLNGSRCVLRMDALDVKILRTMGPRPFMRWPRKDHALKPAQIARLLGRSDQVIKDRVASMEKEGVIRGYGVFPNLRHAGLGATTYHLRIDKEPDEPRLARLRAVDGVVAVLWFYGPHVCFDLAHSSPSERARRLDLIRSLASDGPETLWSHEHAYPVVKRRLTQLDWRIVRALHANARRPLEEVAREVGVTVKTVRTRLDGLRIEGSIDEAVFLDYSRMTGLIPFILYVWLREGASDPTRRLLDLFDDRWFNHFLARGTPPGVLVLHLMAQNPAEVQTLVRQALDVEGVARAEPQMPTGGYWNFPWFAEIIERHAGDAAPPVPGSPEGPAKRETSR